MQFHEDSYQFQVDLAISSNKIEFTRLDLYIVKSVNLHTIFNFNFIFIFIVKY